MRVKKKTLIISFVLLAVLLVTLYFFLFRPVTYEGEGYCITFNRVTKTIVDGYVFWIDFTIPDHIAGFKVKRIGYGAFADRECSARSITIPEGVTKIDDYAFHLSQSLERVTIPESVTSIGKCAFQYSNRLEQISISANVKHIGIGAFCSCDSLREIIVDPDNRYYCSEDGVLFNKEKTELLLCPGKKAGAYAIPESVTSIAADAFWHCAGMTSVTIPSSVTSIGKFAFFDCSGLSEITIPEGVTSIGAWAFAGCSGATNLSIPDTVASISERAFGNCTGLTSITIPYGVTTIEGYAFAQCTELTTVEFPESLKEIGANAFLDCDGLTTVTIPASVMRIDRNVFAECDNLSRVTILNPTCKIAEEYETFGRFPATICGYPGSTAEAYAEAHGYTFVALDS